MKKHKKYSHLPDSTGHYGPYGGRFVPETLVKALDDLVRAYAAVRKNKKFQRELDYYLTEYAGRPTALYEAKNLSQYLGRKIRLFLKREDLLHTGAHKINNTLAQALLARYLGNRYQGVVVEQEAEVRYGPSFNDQLAFRLVEGLKVMINDSKEDWYRITLNDGQSGWILKSKVEPI